MEKFYDIGFGRVKYAPGAPKNLPRWTWACTCKQCEHIPLLNRLHGPFRTRRDAERDVTECLALINADDGTHH